MTNQEFIEYFFEDQYGGKPTKLGKLIAEYYLNGDYTQEEFKEKFFV